jgi:hypothetical protein
VIIRLPLIFMIGLGFIVIFPFLLRVFIICVNLCDLRRRGCCDSSRLSITTCDEVRANITAKPNTTPILRIRGISLFLLFIFTGTLLRARFVFENAAGNDGRHKSK